MDIFRDALPERPAKRISQQPPKLVVDAPGKENLCPWNCRDPNAPLHDSRSPLPEGFPRNPLQDITDVLSPLNMRPKEELRGNAAAAQRVHRRKKTKKESITKAKVTESERSNTSGEGLTEWLTIEVTKKELQIQCEARATEKQEIKQDINRESMAGCDSGIASNVEGGSLHGSEQQKRQRKQARLQGTKPKNSILKLR